MKTLNLTLEKELLIVEVPENSELTAIGNNENVYYAIKHDGEEKYTKVANGKDYKLRCKATYLTEDIAEGLVKNDISDYLVSWAYDYKSKQELNTDSFTYLDSFKSAVESKGFYWGRNPYQNDWDELCEWGYVAIDGKTCSRSDRYENAKERTFNLSRTLIFEKI